MVDYSELFIHESDRAALTALKAIPGFDLVLKKVMEVYDENLIRIEYLSSNLRINENQMPKYYGMLVDVCKKLNINVPDFYLKLDYIPNAWTIGDTKPAIVITSALLETFPDELIPSILAHECGHIICHHCLYNTLAYDLVNGALAGISQFVTVNKIAIGAIQAGLNYWSRCSEISADRVAMVYDGSPNKTIECCMRFCGYDKDINDKFSIDEFLSQAYEYKQLTKDSKWKKLLEMSQTIYRTHPLNSVRAYECSEWSKNNDFNKIVNLYNNDKLVNIPTMYDSKHYEGDNYEEVQTLFEDMGFDNVVVKRINDAKKTKDDKVAEIIINDKGFKKFDWFKNTDRVVITYYQSKTDEEIAAEHPGQHKMPESLNRLKGKKIDDVEILLKDAGFNNIEFNPIELVKKNIFIKDLSVVEVLVYGFDKVQKGDWIDENKKIIITYNKYIV